MPARIRLFSASLIASAAAFVSAAPAQAGLLAPSATNCSAQVSTQIFLPWADVANYTPLPGGNFESGAAGWTLSGGAGVVPGNEPFQVGGSSDASSLGLPAGSSAQSPTMCVGIQNPTLRFFAVNNGDVRSVLNVTVQYWTVLGAASTQIGSVASDGTWQPTVQQPVLANLLALVGDMTPVTFTFTPQGAGNWQVDDIYVDPWNHGG